MIPIRHGQDVGLAQAVVVGDIKVPTESRLAAAAAVGVLLGVLIIEAFAQLKPVPAQLNGVVIDAPATIAPAMTAGAIPPTPVIPGHANVQVPGPAVAPLSVPSALPVIPTAPVAPTAITNPLPVLPPVPTVPSVVTARPSAPPTAAPTAAPTMPVIVPPPPAISLPPVPPLH